MRRTLLALTLISLTAAATLQPPRARAPALPPLLQPDEAAALARHNELRARHGAPSLEWSDALARSAQYMASRCVFIHSRSGLGENLLMGSADLARAVTMWYGEIYYYNFDEPGFDMSTGHFTQVAWMSTRQVGCALDDCDDGVVVPLSNGGSVTVKNTQLVVCQYWPAGNVIGDFARNVAPPRGVPPATPAIIKWG